MPTPSDDTPSLRDAFSFMPLAEAVDAALFLNDFFPGGRNEENPDHAPIDADPGIQPTWWWPKWMPFMTNGGGDYLCADLDPAPAGTVGQVISYYHDESFRRPIAPDIETLFGTVANGLESGTWCLAHGMI